MSLARARRGERTILILGAAVCVLGPLLVYGETFTNKYGPVLDDIWVMSWWGLRSFKEEALSFFHMNPHNDTYRRLSEAFAWIVMQTGGRSRFAQATGGFILHLAVVWAIYGAAARLSRSRVAGVLSAALWSSATVHLHHFLSPINVGGGIGLSALFSALSISLLFSRRWWKMAPLPLALCLMSAEYTVMLFLIVTGVWLLMLARAWQATGRIRSTLCFKRVWAVAMCWLVVMIYIGLQARYGSLRPGSRVTVGSFLQMQTSEWASSSLAQLWTFFSCDNQDVFLRDFEFLLWPVLPGRAYNSVLIRGNSPAPYVSLVAAVLLIVLPLELVAFLRRRGPAILRPETYFFIGWFALATMPLSILVRDIDKSYITIIPAIPVFWFLGLKLRQLQKAALPGFAVLFFVVVLVAYFVSLLCWYPHGIAASFWAKQRRAVGGRLEQIGRDIGDLPRNGRTPAIVLVGLARGDPDDGALAAYVGGDGLRVFYRRSIFFRPVATMDDVQVTPEGRVRVKSWDEVLMPENVRIFDKKQDHYIEVTTSVLNRSYPPAARFVEPPRRAPKPP